MSGEGTSARGRPSSYKPEFAAQAEKLCELGATDMELADFFHADVRTIYRWKHEHEDFCQALKVGKSALDDRVERSLYQRAVGYSFASEKVFQFRGAIVRADTTEHVPPDAGAALSWLKNRRGDKWRDKIDHEHGVTSELANIIAYRRAKVANLNEGGDGD